MLEVRLFGAFSVKCDGTPVVISSRPAQSLFAYLILTAGTLHRREKLAGMFWPDTTEENARAYLRHELWRIRKALASRSNHNFLIADDIHISFNSSAEHWLDITALQNVSDNASIEELSTALSTYQGELLPGFYDDWIIPEREHLQSVYELKMARLLESLEREKCWSDILEWAEHWILHGEGPEAAYWYLMVAYDALGDRAKVASTYGRCVRALRQLDLEPSGRMHALAFRQTSKLHIPVPWTSFVGREAELKEVAHLLSKSRLVTLTGSGGVGKTRLAIEVAANILELFPGGVWFLDLAFLSDAALLPDTLAEVLDLHLMGGSKLSITELIVGYLSSRRGLVIFDNCEHLIDACARLVDSLLTSCNQLSILATSREALRISGEIHYRVPSLELPGPEVVAGFVALANAESTRLFAERAVVVAPGFEVGPHNALFIAQICQRLDGIPLAIELAAARAGMLTVEQILKRLDDRFDLLTGGSRNAVPRHQTLRATLEWSYDLLSEKERILFRRLAVFTGGWTLGAAEFVCSGDGIESREVLDLLSNLVNKSLVVVKTIEDKARYPAGGPFRYRRLETLRQFAREKLFETAETVQLCQRHAMYYADLDPIPDEELENIRSVFNWCLATGEADPALRLARNLFFWEKRVPEGLRFITRVLDLPGAQGATQERGFALYSAAALAYFHRDYPAMRAFVDELLEVGRKLNDFSLIWDQKFISAALAMGERDYQGAYDIYLEIRGQRDSFKYAMCMLGMASCALMLHRLDRARQHAEEARQKFFLLGTNSYLVDVDTLLGYIALEYGDAALARAHFQEGIRTAVSNSVQQKLGVICAGLGGADLREGNFYKSARWFGIAKMITTTTGYHARFSPDGISQGYLAQVKSLLDPLTFQAAWEEGRTMTIEQAIDYALKELG